MDLAALLQTEFEKRKCKNARYSLRAFAKSLGFEAGALLRIMNNKRVATRSTALILLKNLGAPSSLQDEVLASLDARKKFFSKTNKKNGMNPFPEKEFETYFDILHVHTMEALNLVQFQSTKDLPSLAESLGVSLIQLNEVINQLVQLGAIRVEGDEFQVLYKSFSTVPLGFTTEKRKRLQKEFLTKAQEAIDTIPFELRDHSTLTIPVSRKDLIEIKMILKRARSRINSLSDKRSKRDQLYNISMALYPVVL